VKWGALVLAVLSLALIGCDKKLVVSPSGTDAPNVPEAVDPISSSFQTQDDLKPGELPPKEATVILTGAQIPVVLDAKRSGEKIVLRWITDAAKESGDPVEVETEVYLSGDEGFSIARAPHETYDPPIRLIRYPLEVGDTWEWSGTIQSGVNVYPASATISTSSDALNLASGKFPALLVTAEVKTSAGAVATKRNLKFWFQPEKGLIRREFWQSSTREPRVDDPATPESP